jgi:hypothetical protein
LLSEVELICVIQLKVYGAGSNWLRPILDDIDSFDYRLGLARTRPRYQNGAYGRKEKDAHSVAAFATTMGETYLCAECVFSETSWRAARCEQGTHSYLALALFVSK